jgi:hypothetical protein
MECESDVLQRARCLYCETELSGEPAKVGQASAMPMDSSFFSDWLFLASCASADEDVERCLGSGKPPRGLSLCGYGTLAIFSHSKAKRTAAYCFLT